MTLPCPCCGYLTLMGAGDDEICPVCFWHDDGQGDNDADVVRGGPNHLLSLSAARANFRTIGAIEPRFVSAVRPPRDDERPA